MLFNLLQKNDLIAKKEAFLEENKLRINDFYYSQSYNSLLVSYFFNGQLCNITLNVSQLLSIFQFDENITSYDARKITTHYNTYSYPQYFANITRLFTADVLALHFAIIHTYPRAKAA